MHQYYANTECNISLMCDECNWKLLIMSFGCNYLPIRVAPSVQMCHNVSALWFFKIFSPTSSPIILDFLLVSLSNCQNKFNHISSSQFLIPSITERMPSEMMNPIHEPFELYIMWQMSIVTLQMLHVIKMTKPEAVNMKWYAADSCGDINPT